MSVLLYPRSAFNRKGMFVLALFVVLSATLIAAHLLQPESLIPTSLTNSGNALAHLPIPFEANSGQADSSVQYVAHSGGDTLLFAQSAVTLVLESSPEGAKLS